MPGHDAQPLVQLCAQLADLTCVLGERLLLPGQGDGLQRRHQSVGRRQHDALPQRVVLQSRVGLASGGQQRLARNESHNELGRALELSPVFLL